MFIVYAGLGGTLLALIVATAQNKWQWKVFFLLALRLAIGWHFLFEGMHKIHSHAVGPTDTNRPFSSEPYFKEAPGPLGGMMRAMAGDPQGIIDAKVKAKSEITPQKFQGLKPDEQAALCPDSVSKDLAAFGEKVPGVNVEAAKIKYARWVYGVDGLDTKIKFVTGDVSYTAPQRLIHLEMLKKEVDESDERRSDGLGNGYGTDTKKTQATRSEYLAAVAELAKDAESYVVALKKWMIAVLLADKAPSPDSVYGDSKAADAEAKLAAILPTAAPSAVAFDAIPAPIREMWNKYSAEFHSVYALTETESEKANEAFAERKQRLANWYFGREEVMGAPKPGSGFEKLAKDYKDAAPEKKADARKALVAGLDGKFDELKASLAAAVPADNAVKQTIEPTVVSPIVRMDKITMWAISIFGACLLLGLFTRLNCVLAAGFLIMTYLTHPPFPWYTLPPGTEGNPLFINKNVIECLALLSLACLPTGRWLGLDALIARCFGCDREKAAKPVESKTATANRSLSN